MMRAPKREELLTEAARIRKEIQQIFLDAAHWNAMHPREEPIDVDPDGALKRTLRYLPKEES